MIERLGNELIGGKLSQNEFMIGKSRANIAEAELIMICCHWTKYWIYNRKMGNCLALLRELKTDWEISKNSMLRKQRFCRVSLLVCNICMSTL